VEKFKLRTVLGSKMYFIPEDGGISKELLYGSKHFSIQEPIIREGRATLAVIDYLRKGMICIDIGANLGYYALLEARKVEDTGYVYAIEPVKKNAETLEKSIKINKFKNIKVYQLAIGSDNCDGEIFIHSKSNLCMINSPKLKERDGNIGISKTKILTLDSFCKIENINRIDLLRMDVEGYEAEIIKGMGKAVKLMPKGAMMFIEIHPKHMQNMKLAKKMIDIIKAYGFKMGATQNISSKIRNLEELKKELNDKKCPRVIFRKI